MPVLIPAAVTQMAEPKQHCKATVPQLNIKKKTALDGIFKDEIDLDKIMFSFLKNNMKLKTKSIHQ